MRADERPSRWSGATLTIGGAQSASPQHPVPSATDDRRDYEELIDTVKSSLWGLLDTPSGQTPSDPPPQEPARVRLTAMQGAIALDRLQSNLAQAFEAREKLEQDIRDAHLALETMRAELAGTRADERQARYLAAHDQLTGLANRGHFQERLDAALASNRPQAERLAILYIDLDDFKPINDTYGHAAGDMLLRIVAGRLRRAVRAADLVCRLGGDEFACLLAGMTCAHDAQRLASKLRDALRTPCKIGDQLVQVDASIGIAIEGPDEHSGADLLLKADMAMYRAKREGSGVACYDAPAPT